MTTNESKQENTTSRDTRISRQGNPKRKDWLAKFCEARFDTLRQSLSPENQAKWDGFSYDKKCSVIQSMVSKGYMI